MEKFRKARVFYNQDLAGYISETKDGYSFEYNKEFLKKNIPLSVALPLREEPYESKELFSFFRGLLPEGWYLDIVTATQKVDREDLFGLLLCTTNLDTIGAVTVRRIDDPGNE
ncbi:MAG: HipA N-terminal domain-containing protein [Candidatus Omnitrophica bacterium]|nr:HipA N-terminal domain-containing protein [Candidatus Omnitrophota bacterium]MBU4468557.1 HipA N-terminal domain-containing protein [Candidatus Omnitrophota bacterium]MCG2707773.1 HipA N-terminal domain-containing protein [Candidatus Omnitrophota bacterium]